MTGFKKSGWLIKACQTEQDERMKTKKRKGEEWKMNSNESESYAKVPKQSDVAKNKANQLEKCKCRPGTKYRKTVNNVRERKKRV
jgi:hypothetical protein